MFCVYVGICGYLCVGMFVCGCVYVFVTMSMYVLCLYLNTLWRIGLRRCVFVCLYVLVGIYLFVCVCVYLCEEVCT